MAVRDYRRVTEKASTKTTHIVIGAKGTRQDTKRYTEKGIVVLSEAEFLSMILAQVGHSVNAKKRDVEASQGEPVASSSSKSRKVQKADESALPTLKWATDFARGNEIRIEGKTLTAFDCGGTVFKAQRGKSLIELLQKFDKFLEECDGDYHYHPARKMYW
ncbi:hypothetical protein SCHPADRAFT_472056 [Schizopora paradoxa]|uniref:BRCT domain-containing protein n=1 Tax=Schizopora paradoxa TaxID=27342 RepID=A0A0H2RIH9_9AGAM|nr:hypothetical protein SCHPADRAFT_472056 [Schizopora paradoxa]